MCFSNPGAVSVCTTLMLHGLYHGTAYRSCHRIHAANVTRLVGSQGSRVAAAHGAPLRSKRSDRARSISQRAPSGTVLTTTSSHSLSYRLATGRPPSRPSCPPNPYSNWPQKQRLTISEVRCMSSTFLLHVERLTDLVDRNRGRGRNSVSPDQAHLTSSGQPGAIGMPLFA